MAPLSIDLVGGCNNSGSCRLSRNLPTRELAKGVTPAEATRVRNLFRPFAQLMAIAVVRNTKPNRSARLELELI
jgi:hypothetical protein